MSTMNPVVHFEMPAEDISRMKKFYETAFGWQMNQLGPDMGDYVVVMTAESDRRGPKEPGRINGGFFKKTEDNAHPSVVVAVDNLEESMKKVEEAGGKINGQPYDIPGVGKYVAVTDTEGNRVSMLEPLPM